jgi:hypothetical protein
MIKFLRDRWRLVSSMMLGLTLLGAGGATAYTSLKGDCCVPGAPCCYPGSPCCHGHGNPTAPKP